MTLILPSAAAPAHPPSASLARPRVGLAFAAAGVGVFALHLALIWTHVAWLDEFQAALLARHSHALADWWTNFRYEGHAPLWHLLLKAAMQFGADDAASLKIAATACACATTALVWARAPFSPGLRLLLVCNYFILFEFGAISRDYTLGVPLFLAAIAFRRHWASWLIVALLPQAGLQFVMLAAICVWIGWWEKRFSWAGLVLVGLGVAVALAWMHPNADFEAFGSLDMQKPLRERIVKALVMMGAALIPTDVGGAPIGWRSVSTDTIAAAFVAGLALPIIVGLASRRLRWLMVASLGFTVASVALGVFVYTLHTRHYGLIVLLLIGCWWIEQEHGLTRDIFDKTLAALWALGGLGAAATAFSAPFSGSAAAAQWVRDHGYASRLIIPIDQGIGDELVSLLDRPMLNVVNACTQTFAFWKGHVFLGEIDDKDPLKRDAAPAQERQAIETIKAIVARGGGDALLVLDDNSAKKLMAQPDAALQAVGSTPRPSGPGVDRVFVEVHVPAAPDAQPFPRCLSPDAR